MVKAEEEIQSLENGRELSTEEKEELQEHVLTFLDSMDNYLILMDSLSSTLREAWIELASARHSMGALRINSALLDLKHHSATTTLHVNSYDAGSTENQQQFILRKWASSDDKKSGSEDAKYEEDELLQGKSEDGSPLQHHTMTDSQKNSPKSNGSESIGSPLAGNNHVRKERSKSLSIFGTLVSPKLRDAQLSFESALEKIIEIANVRSSMLRAYDQVHKEMKDSTG